MNNSTFFPVERHSAFKRKLLGFVCFLFFFPERFQHLAFCLENQRKAKIIRNLFLEQISNCLAAVAQTRHKMLCQNHRETNRPIADLDFLLNMDLLLI